MYDMTGLRASCLHLACPFDPGHVVLYIALEDIVNLVDFLSIDFDWFWCALVSLRMQHIVVLCAVVAVAIYVCSYCNV